VKGKVNVSQVKGQFSRRELKRGKSSALNEYKAVLLLSHQRKEKKNKKLKCAH
jgi:hypothetical protein